MIIGITGGTGCGKTTLLKEIEARGGQVLDCDAVYHELLTRDEVLLNTINDRFPGVVVDKKLERKKLGAIVFSDEKALADLNAITHRYIGAAIRARIAQAKEQGRPAAAIDAIRLFESGLAGDCHTTLAITAPPEIRVGRIMAREGISEEYARARVASQPSDDFFTQRCDHVLINDCATAEEFGSRARTLFESILSTDIH